MFLVVFVVVVVKMRVQIHIVFVKTVGCTVIVVMKKGGQTHIVFVRTTACTVIVKDGCSNSYCVCENNGGV